jgi:hypothetical protein
MRALSIRSVAVPVVVVLTPLAMALVPFASLASGAAGASQDPGGSGWGGWGGHGEPALTARTILAGGSLTHTFTVAGTSTVSSGPLSSPDDITMLGRDIFVGFQNGVGPQGQPSSSGNQDSTIVEISQGGQPIAQWDIAGKADGVTADPGARTVIATVNEDANSSLYTITPGWGGGVQHYRYNEPLPHGGGTDAISVVDGRLYISASAPGTTGMLPAPQPTFPAVYTVSLDRFDSIATVTPLFYDEDPATVANVGTGESGRTVPLALTDPDSSEVVPRDAPRFAGDFMLTSQGDQQQIFVNPWDHGLAVLNLTQSVDDTAWPDGGHGTLYATDSSNDTVDAVTGDFPGGPVVAATPCGSNSAPATCPDPPTFPANYLGSVNPWTGQVSALTVGGVPFVPQGGLLYVDGWSGQGQQ